MPVRLKVGVLSPIRFGDEDEADVPSDRCHDCDVVAGGFHHRGCDSEVCPVCRKQLIWFRPMPALATRRWTENHFCNRIPVFTLPSIFDGSVPLLVAHDADGDWQVLDGKSVEGKQIVIACVADVTDLHPSLVEVLDLPRGWEAWRDDEAAVWKRAPL